MCHSCDEIRTDFHRSVLEPFANKPVCCAGEHFSRPHAHELTGYMSFETGSHSDWPAERRIDRKQRLIRVRKQVADDRQGRFTSAASFEMHKCRAVPLNIDGRDRPSCVFSRPIETDDSNVGLHPRYRSSLCHLSPSVAGASCAASGNRIVDPWSL